MKVAHLLASPFFGGPERQVLGLARALSGTVSTLFLSFAERGLSEAFLIKAREAGFPTVKLRKNFPFVFQASREIASHLCEYQADVLCCSGYKPDIVGWLAARQVGIPVVAIAHGWTGVTWKVKLNETIDRLVMRRMDAVVAVSAAMAKKVRNAGVRADKIHIIRNALDLAPFEHKVPAYRERLLALFGEIPQRIIVAAGRLSPEKGFDQLIEAAVLVCQKDHGVGFVLFGDGPLKEKLTLQIRERGLSERFVLGGFQNDLERWIPHADLAVLSSYTEGLPVAVLEAMAAGLPVVATAVGGTPEVIEEGKQGYLVPPGNPIALADSLLALLADEGRRLTMGRQARQRVEKEFTFTAQGQAYERLFDCLIHRTTRMPRSRVRTENVPS